MKLHYHQATADLLGEQLTFSKAAMKLVEQQEDRHGIVFPAAVREWYCLDGAVAILKRHSNDDQPVPINTLGQEGDLSSKGISSDLLLIMYENQGVVTWAVHLDGSEDPPVVVTDQESDDTTRWLPYADHFSTFIYTQMWDWPPHNDFRLQAMDIPLTPVTVEYLRARYPAGPQTYHWPGQITYRFGEPSARIVIWDDQQRQADWWLMANSQEALATLARQVWHLGGLSGTLEGESDAAEAVLSALLSE